MNRVYKIAGHVVPQAVAALTVNDSSEEVNQVEDSSEVVSVVEGEKGTTEFRRRFLSPSGQMISPWHDVKLHTANEGIFNFVVEIPKMSKPKMEVATKVPGNPIMQDVKKGKPREYHGPIYWNYGMFPQTWEDPGVEHPEMKVKGDDDPLDVVEIGSQKLECGAVEPVKPLGVLAMIDDGELDWKVIAISTKDPMANELDDIGDVQRKCPGVVSGIREWLRWYKTPDGKPTNAFGYGERALNKEKALDVIAETHEAWKRLCQRCAENPGPRYVRPMRLRGQ
mmetsp:Transcript_129347/g.241990  ORF Transcript_129347/g.241990 Transcript_129347/m.241990 type:complete len:281 (-) Transcript_129347:265-1107(-)